MNRRFDSDLDAADAVAGIPEDALMARQEEMDREARWAAFVAWLREEYQTWSSVDGHLSWASVVGSAADGFRSDEGPADRDRHHEYQQPYRDFAATEGWDGVLVAIARAMREQAQERERLLAQG